MYMLFYVVKGIWQIWLSQGCWETEIILDDLGGLNLVTSLYKRKKGRNVREREREDVITEAEAGMMGSPEPKNAGRL